MLATHLRWADVDPDIRPPVDAARLTELVRPVVAAAATARGEGFREHLVDAIHRALLIELRPWVAGWTWSASEPGGGGPVRGWCCAEHSLFPLAEDPAGGPRSDLADADDDPVTASTARVVAAVLDWQACLVELGRLFAELSQPATKPPSIDREVERAAGRVLAWVIERTGAEDAWYATFTNVLSWYVERAGYDRDLARAAIHETITGKFESWIEPAPELAAATCDELGRAIRHVEAGSSERDATAAWQAMRVSSFGRRVAAVHVPVRADGHRRFIDRVDRARDPERAERMSAALELCRDSARRGMALTFDQLCEWQAIVLGERDVGFRSGTAYAKGGREVYPLGPATRAQFEDALRDADGPGELALQAARVYLDLCFWHPFVDGNARAARLAMDHVLTRAGYALHAADPVFVVAWTVDDRRVGWSLAHVLDRLIGPVTEPHRELPREPLR